MKKLAIIGGGGHAKVVASIILKLNEYEIVGYVDQSEKESFFDLPYLGNDENFIKTYKTKIEYVALGIGQMETSKIRRAIVSKYISSEFKFPQIVSPTSIINKNVSIGVGTIVMDGVIINAESQIGEYTIINTNSIIEHDCKIGNYVHVAPSVTMSGNVTIGDACMIGVGTTIIQGIKIIENTFVGAGSVVIKNLDLVGRYFGVPAKRIKLKI